jgi:hypothetical protein
MMMMDAFQRELAEALAKEPRVFAPAGTPGRIAGVGTQNHEGFNTVAGH